MLEIIAAPVELDALIRAVRTDACGAVVTFAGVVRLTSPDDPRPVLRIRYEAYPALALTQMREIAAATRATFGPLEIAIVHRVGELTLGETSIAIAVAAPHRGRAFDASPASTMAAGACHLDYSRSGVFPMAIRGRRREARAGRPR